MARHYTIEYKPSAAKQLRKIKDRQAQRKIVAAIGALADQPRPPGCVKISSGAGELRIRIGDWRVIYEINDNQLRVLVLRIAHRREAYDRRN